MQEDEEEGLAICGCRLINDEDGARIIMCPTHSAAPDLIAALVDAEFLLRKVGINPKEALAMVDSLKRSAADARAAIAKALGGQE